MCKNPFSTGTDELFFNFKVLASLLLLVNSLPGEKPAPAVLALILGAGLNLIEGGESMFEVDKVFKLVSQPSWPILCETPVIKNSNVAEYCAGRKDCWIIILL